MTIAQYVHRLTRPHLSFTPDGKAGEVPSLLTELRAAVTHSASGGGDGADGKPLPFNTVALELLQFIERTIGEDHYRRYDERFVGTLEGILQKIADDTHPGEHAAYFERIFMEWCDEIDEMIRPARVRRLDGAPCPSCEQRIHGPGRETCVIVDCFKPGGGKDLRPIGTWTAHCRACGAEWSGGNMKYLLASLAA